MAKGTSSEHRVKIVPDFADVVREAQKVGKRTQDIIAAATEKGVGKAMKAQIRALNDLEKRRADLEKKHHDLAQALDDKRTGEYEKKLESTLRRINELTRDLNDQTIDEEVKKAKRAEVKKLKEKKALLDRFIGETEDTLVQSLAQLNRELSGSMHEQEKTMRSLARASDQVARGSARSSKIMAMFRRDAERGADDWADSLSGSLDNFKSKLTNFDLASTLQGGLGGAGKGIGGLAEMLSGFGASRGGMLGGMAGALGSTLMVVGPLVAALGVLGGAILALDSQIKDANKSIVNTFGTRSVMNLGMGSFEDNLKVVRHATQDLVSVLGLTEQEAVGVLDAFDAGGVTFSRLTKGVRDQAQAQRALQGSIVATAATAKSLGVGVNEFIGTMTEYMDSLALSLDDVTGQFSLVAKQAAEAGFSTRRFYSLIVQATAGQASLNTRLDTTAQLMIKMAKVLGEKQAAEALGGAAGAFKDMGTSDRYRTMMTTGMGRTKRVIEQSARRQAASFTQRSDLNVSNLTKAMKDSGVAIDPSAFADQTGQTLVKELSMLSRTDQAKMLAAITSSSDKEIQAQGRALSQLVMVTRGTSGNMADMSDALSALDPGATIAMKLQSAMAVLGRPIHELSGVQRMAAEQITGMSGAQFEQYQALAAQAEGQFMILKSIRKEGLPEDPAARKELNERLIKQYGGMFDEQGRIVDHSGQEITSAMDLLTSTVENGEFEAKIARSEDLDLAYKAFDATVSISDILGNEINNWLRRLYEEFGVPVTNMMSDLVGRLIGGEDRETRMSRQGFEMAASKRIQAANVERLGAGRTIAQLERKKELTDEEKSQLEHARETVEIADAVIKSMQAAQERVRQGNTWDLRAKSLHSGGTYDTVILSPEDAAKQVEARAVKRARAGRTVTPVSAAPAVAPVATPVTAPVAPPVASSPAARVAQENTEAVTDAMAASGETVAETTSQEAEETRVVIEDQAKQSRTHLEKILTRGQKLGNALARSNLPDAIVEAQVRQQFASLAFASGLGDEAVKTAMEEYFSTGKISGGLTEALRSQGAFEADSPLAGLMASLGIMPGERGAGRVGGLHRLPTRSESGSSGGGPRVDDLVEDFIYRGDGVRGTITPIDSADEFVGMKPGGPVDQAMRGGGAVINIYGGDERRVYDVVKRVLTQAGIGPTRVGSRA